MTGSPLYIGQVDEYVWSISGGGLEMRIDAATGARIVSFTRDGIEALTQPSAHPQNYGSTFWDAPQSAWGWPPRAVLDVGVYGAARVGDAVEMTSAIDPDSGLRFAKRFVLDAPRGRVEIRYAIENQGETGRSVGPWELTRVPGGLSFFPELEVSGLPPSQLVPLQRSHGICWYSFDAAELVTGKKLFGAAREGWLAHVSPDHLLFIKRFEATAPEHLAPGQGGVEIWGQDGGPYVELENHGRYVTLAPGERTEYRVDWYLERLPQEVEVAAGNPELAELVRDWIAVAEAEDARG
jgi:hypothetical protein